VESFECCADTRLDYENAVTGNHEVEKSSGQKQPAKNRETLGAKALSVESVLNTPRNEGGEYEGHESELDRVADQRKQTRNKVAAESRVGHREWVCDEMSHDAGTN